ncbi:MAG: universal stress protein [Burkholderiaceae bacterium]|nr:universal stress protein [Burkholderiaceae bacterium]
MKIIVPVDGSVYSNNAVSFITHRTSLIGKNPTIVLVNVQPHLPARALGLASPETLQIFYKEEFDKTLGSAREILQKAGMKYEEVTLVGNPADMIAQEAEKRNADLIVMGSHGHTAMEGLLFGSVTNGVLAQTKTPVLMLRGQEVPHVDHLKVGVAVDGSEFSTKAVKYMLTHRALFGQEAEYEVISAVYDEPNMFMMPAPGLSLMGLTKEKLQLLQQEKFAIATEPTKPLFEEAGVKAKEVLLIGNPGEEIGQYAARTGLDVLVLGSHGYGRFMSAVMGSTAMRIAHASNVPLLIVRN